MTQEQRKEGLESGRRVRSETEKRNKEGVWYVKHWTGCVGMALSKLHSVQTWPNAFELAPATGPA